ncbi:MAG TPA: aminoglycoside phosphotransferase family protein [Chitinophagaceae bacterium]|nr:aminoglycoside phosphotransferase family protein [Chitinophagaceae bacterium]
MPSYTPSQIKSKTAMARKVVKHHFGKSLEKIEFKPAGKTNFVFDVVTKEGNFIVRIANSRAKLNDFMKEQWATQKALKAGVPVPEILEVGHEIISLPYMLQQKIEGEEAVNHPDRLKILLKLGKYARMIHSIPTTGFGKVFDWSKNKLSKKKTWVDFLENELQVTGGFKFLHDNDILPKKKINRLNVEFGKLKRWKVTPSLNHCDLRLKNVIVNEAGEIKAILDWEDCSSNCAPYWDFSIALHDLSIDGKQKFLEGYELDVEEFGRKAYALTVFNIINYIPALQRIIDKKDKKRLALYKLRLDGAMDLFSI